MDKLLIIRLLNYIKHKTRIIRASRPRIYKRDHYQCVYCGSSKDLSLNHVIPKTRGGGNEWTNLVTSCFKCNLKKGNKTLEESRMILRVKPTQPTFINDYDGLNNLWDTVNQSFLSN